MRADKCPFCRPHAEGRNDRPTDRRTNSAAFPRIRERRANLRSLARSLVRRRFCVDTLHTWSYDVDGDVDGSRRWSEGKKRRRGRRGRHARGRSANAIARAGGRAGDGSSSKRESGFSRYHLEKAPPNICCRCFCKIGQFSQNALTKGTKS